jgi:hypothetical protein
VGVAINHVNKKIAEGANINGTYQVKHSGEVDHDKSILTKLVELYLRTNLPDEKDKPKKILRMIEKVIECGGDPNKPDGLGNSAMSLVKYIGGTYQTNLNEAIKQGLERQPPRTNIHIDNLEQPSTSRGLGR